ncbi:hypothetical protein HYT04_01760 [Candidatus Kaiserbacteria bacterium]|nr:hypothetical protein [Candidatus Kaiserbacteria bacterium]
MGFFSNIFNPTNAESLVLIDVSAGSVAGAYAHYKDMETPSILYTRRLPIEVRSGERHELAMLRALEILGNALIKEGAPALARATGSGRADAILVSVDAPWQETRVRTEYFERKTPFVFTKRMVATALEKTSIPADGKVLADESIIGTILNGYETREPYGKKVHRAAVIILTSFIDEKISEGIAGMLSKLFHTKNIFSIAGSSLRYQAMRTAFPHERDALLLDAVGQLISIALVRRDLLVAVVEASDTSTENYEKWVEKVVLELTELAKDHPLPRTIFLLAQEKDSPSLEQALNSAKLGGLWLSDNPPKIVPVRAGHLSGSIRQITTASPDLPLLLMALYWQHHRK